MGASDAIKISQIGLQSPTKPASRRGRRRRDSNTSSNGVPPPPPSPFSSPDVGATRRRSGGKHDINGSLLLSPPTTPITSPTLRSRRRSKKSVGDLARKFEEQGAKKPPPSPLVTESKPPLPGRRSLLKKSASASSLAVATADVNKEADSLSVSTHSVSSSPSKKKKGKKPRAITCCNSALLKRRCSDSDSQSIGDGLFQSVLQRQTSSSRLLTDMLDDAIEVTTTAIDTMDNEYKIQEPSSSLIGNNSGHYSTATTATLTTDDDDDISIDSCISDGDIEPTPIVNLSFCENDGLHDSGLLQSVFQRQTSSRRLLMVDDDEDGVDGGVVGSPLPKRRSAPAAETTTTSSKLALLRAKKRNLETRHSSASPTPPRPRKSIVDFETSEPTPDEKNKFCRRQALLKTKSATWLNSSARSIGSDKPESSKTLIDILKEEDESKEKENDNGMAQTNVEATALVASMLPTKLPPRKRNSKSTVQSPRRCKSLIACTTVTKKDGGMPPPPPMLTPGTSRKKAWEMRGQWKKQSSIRNLNKDEGGIKFQRPKERIDLLERSQSLRKFLKIEDKKDDDKDDFKIFSPKPDDLFFNKKENNENIIDEKKNDNLRDREQRRLQRRLQRRRAKSTTDKNIPSMFTAHLDFP